MLLDQVQDHTPVRPLDQGKDHTQAQDRTAVHQKIPPGSPSEIGETKPVGDDVDKSEGVVAVGEDLAFQQRWWRFERVIWVVFGLILLADASGLLGRGPLSKAQKHTADGALEVKYEVVERANTPSILTIHPGATAVRDGVVRVFVTDTIVDKLGEQRIVPQPLSSTVGNGGVTFNFPATALPITIQFALQPSFVGLHRFAVGVPGGETVQGKVFVLP